MELKKTAKADLENKKSLFLEIGLVVAIGVVILLFNYSKPERDVTKMTEELGPVEVDITEITRQPEKQPEPIKTNVTATSDIINVVKNDTKVSTSLDFTEFVDDAVVVPKTEVKEETVSTDEIYITVQEMPKFMGGDLNTFRAWVFDHLVYPEIATQNGISGRVTLEFVVERDGTLSNIVVLQSPDRSLSDEAVRVLKTSPKWTPGKQRNTTVRVKYVMPVDFRLQ